MRALLLAALLVLAGCRSARSLEPLPVKLGAEDVPAAPLDSEELAARASRVVWRVEQDTRAIKPFSEYAHDVGTSFVSMLVSPITAPLFVFELFFGWLDFSKTWGSGFAVDRAGHVVTNAHVVGDETELTLERTDGVKARADVVAVDEDRDLALLKIRLMRGAALDPDEIAPVGTSASVRLGRKVLLYGFPNRPWDQERPVPTVTAGVVSSLGVDVGEAAKRIQLDAAANHGSSGCPVIDEHGTVIGVVTEASDAFESQTFAIPIDDVKKAFFEPRRETPHGDSH